MKWPWVKVEAIVTHDVEMTDRERELEQEVRQLKERAREEYQMRCDLGDRLQELRTAIIPRDLLDQQIKRADALQDRYLAAVDAHAATMVELTKHLAGLRPASNLQAPAEVTRIPSPEEAVNAAINSDLETATNRLLAKYDANGITVSREEAMAEARGLLAEYYRTIGE